MGKLGQLLVARGWITVQQLTRALKTQNVAGGAALEASLVGYQNPVPADVLEFQMRIAIREATDLNFVPPAFRAMAQTT